MSECRSDLGVKMASRIRCSQPFPSLACAQRGLWRWQPVASCDIYHTQIGTIDRSHTNSRGSECDVLHVSTSLSVQIVWYCTVVQWYSASWFYPCTNPVSPGFSPLCCTVLTAPIKFWRLADAELFSASGPGQSTEVSPKAVQGYTRKVQASANVSYKDLTNILQRSCKCVKACKELQYKVHTKSGRKMRHSKLLISILVTSAKIQERMARKRVGTCDIAWHVWQMRFYTLHPLSVCVKEAPRKYSLVAFLFFHKTTR